MCLVVNCDTCEQEVVVACGYDQAKFEHFIKTDVLLECMQCAKQRARVEAKAHPRQGQPWLN